MSHRMMQLVALHVPYDACTRVAYRVLLLAADSASEDGLAPVDRPWCVRVLGCARKTVDAAVRELVAADLLARVTPPQLQPDNTWRAAVYRVLPEVDA